MNNQEEMMEHSNLQKTCNYSMYKHIYVPHVNKPRDYPKMSLVRCLAAYLKQRKTFERQKPTMRLPLLTLHKIEQRIKDQECPDVQKALREGIRDVLYLKRGRHWSYIMSR